MYKQYFNFSENPFNITPDPDFFFASSRHSEAFSHLEFGIKQRKGIILITGEIGTGKTTLCKILLNRLDDNIKSALILNPTFSDVQLLRLIIKDLGITTSAKNKYDLIDALNTFLLMETSHGNNVVLIIDECQNLTVRQLEQIRLLSNLETAKEKLLQIVLVGQPELLEKLKLPSLRQLNQRIAVRYHIMPLERDEMENYIQHRLKIAVDQKKVKPNVVFTEKALNTIYENSLGTPRMINVLCDRALLAGFVGDTTTIDERIVHKCVQEVGRK